MKRALLFLGVTLLLAGCTGPGELEANTDPSVAKHASLTVRNEDPEAHTLHVTTFVGETPLDNATTAVAANGTSTLEIGFPASGNVRIHLLVEPTGRTVEATLGAGACEEPDLGAVIREGAPSLPDIRCG